MIVQHQQNLRRELKPQVSNTAVDPQAESDLDRQLRMAEEWIGHHPSICLGIALIAGVGLGWLIKRR